ncbi:MAG: hypothetical protein D6812_04250, partial [Deltaproteobacteria bacterium]
MRTFLSPFFGFCSLASSKGFLCLLFLTVSFPVFADSDPLPPLPPPVSPEEQRALTLFTEVFRIIRDHSWEEVSPQVLIEGAIAGMLARLDPYAAFHPRGTG